MPAKKPVGRPPGSTIKKKKKTKKTVDKNPPGELTEYICCVCNAKYKKQQGHFHASNSKFYRGTGYITMCNKCIDFFEETMAEEFGHVEAIHRICKVTDVYFHQGMALKVSTGMKTGVSRMGSYIKLLNLPMNHSLDKNYQTYIDEQKEFGNLRLDGEPIIRSEHDESEDESDSPIVKKRWNTGDTKNKNYVIQSVGYDCFADDSYTDDDRKFLFNALADYLTDEIIEDAHKTQSVISMVKTILQIENIDHAINEQLTKTKPDYELIETLSKVKDKFLRNNNATANDNGISEKHGGRFTKGTNTLTNITKEMLENNFDGATTNIVGVKMTNAYKTVAEQNARALIAELNYQSDDYARLLGERTIFVEELQEKLMLLEEENRKLKVKIKAEVDV